MSVSLTNVGIVTPSDTKSAATELSVDWIICFTNNADISVVFRGDPSETPVLLSKIGPTTDLVGWFNGSIKYVLATNTTGSISLLWGTTANNPKPYGFFTGTGVNSAGELKSYGYINVDD